MNMFGDIESRKTQEVKSIAVHYRASQIGPAVPRFGIYVRGAGRLAFLVQLEGRAVSIEERRRDLFSKGRGIFAQMYSWICTELGELFA